MTTFLWDVSDDYPEELVGEYDRENSPDRFQLRCGRKVDDDFGRVVFRFNRRLRDLQSWDCLENSALVPLVAPRVLELLSNVAADDVQVIDTVVLAVDGELSGYRAVNIACKVRCVDLERSRFKKIAGTDRIMKFLTLRHLTGCIGNHHIARESEYMSHIIVSDVLKSAFESAVVTGVRFLRPEDVR